MSSATIRNPEPIPGYRLKRRIGAGGYGEVWEADAPGELQKAVKIVYGMMDEDRAMREAKALQRIKAVRHPFILSLERIEVVDGQLYIVTELAECSLKDLYDRVRKEGKHGLPREELLRHLRDAADALDFMSEQYSLQHLDVKPENMLLVGGRVKIADFGLVKDIHDCTASMMGGLTPIYAPPELFEGRPTRRSDQYSLAIVYQEMLTGVLPFPGKTAAQLANQHLNAKPRLSVLPEADQTVISRALAKTPEERFGSCREMIDCLSRSEAANAAPLAAAPRAVNESVTQGMTVARQALEQARPKRQADYAATPVRSESEMLDNAEQAQQACQGESFAAAPCIAPKIRTESPTRLRDRDPVERAASSCHVQPTLIVGIGGLAGKALNAYRRRLEDAETPLDQRPQFLLLDADGRELMRATREAAGAALAPEETIHLSLRRPQDYRDGSRQILSWLSRRWLYNIPRSLQTEGVRPLGRLALVDHSDEVWARLRRAIAALVDRRQTSRNPEPPRIVLVSALGGGMGGGSALDVALMARQVCDEQKLAAAEIIAGLVHAVPAGAQPQQLAAANVASALAEWAGLLAAEQSPGDAALKLKPRPAFGIVNHCYFLQFGEGFADSPAVDAVAPLANWLWLETLSPAAPALRAIRNHEPAERGAFMLRSLGVASRSAMTRDLVETQALRLCFHLMQRWQGTPPQPRQQQTRTTGLLSGLRITAVSGDMTTEAMLARVEQSAKGFAQSQRLSSEELVQDSVSWIVNEFRMPADTFFAEIPKAVARQQNGAVIPTEKWLVAVNEIFGAPPTDITPNPPPGALADTLAEGVKTRAVALGRKLAQWVEGLLNQPIGRLLAAQRAQRTMTSLLKEVVEKLRERRASVVEQMHAADAAFRTMLSDLQAPKPRNKNVPVLTPEAAFQQVGQARIGYLAWQQAMAVAQGAIGALSACNDGLFDLAREMRSLASVFYVDDQPEGQGDEDSADPLRELAKQRLDEAQIELADLFDQRLSEQWLAPANGLKPFLLKEISDRAALIARFQDEARRLVLDTLRSYDLAGAVSEVNAATGGGPWRAALKEARNGLTNCGGERRLLCLLPATAPTDPEVWRRLSSADGFQAAPDLIRCGASEITFSYEIGAIPVGEVLGKVLDARHDLAEAADRLHTRADINWPQIEIGEG